MAFVNLYINAAASGASDLNSGSTTAAPTHTYGGGTFVRATNTYTVASGNPSTDGFVSAGDYVSVYTTSGRTVATFVMKVDSTTSTTIVGSATGIVYGVNTTVSETANASTLTIGGSWATLLPIGATGAAGGLGTFTVPQSTKLNVKQATYSVGAALTCSIAGATTAPFWLSGYNANPGDLDADTTNSLSKPIISMASTFQLSSSGVQQLWSSFTVTGSRSGTLFGFNSANTVLLRCRVSNTSSNAAAVAAQCNSAGSQTYAYCYFSCPSTASTTGVFQGNEQATIGCVFDGGGIAGLNQGSSARNVVVDCVFINNTGAGILFSTGRGYVANCTFYGCTVDGVKWSGTPSGYAQIMGCLFSGLNGSTATTNGINNASGTNTNLIVRACNDYYNVTNPEVALGDSFAFFPQTDSSFPAASGTNLIPVATSNAWRHGFPGIFENETYSGFTSIGAVDPLITGLWIS